MTAAQSDQLGPDQLGSDHVRSDQPRPDQLGFEDAPSDVPSPYISALDQRLQAPGPKRILALDGGGVKGILTSGMLEVIEERLRGRIADEAARERFRLCDYFDLIGGTSTGAIVAAWLALGHTAKEVSDLYRSLCQDVFRPFLQMRNGVPRINWSTRIPLLQAKFESKHFEAVIRNKLTEIAARDGLAYDDMTLDTPLLKTGLAIFCKRADTRSPWIITNNPRAKYWDGAAEPWRGYWDDYYASRDAEPRFAPNAKYRLGDLVQASAAAPTFLNAVNFEVDHGVEGRFVDGAVSTNNNPALSLFLAATLRGYDSRSTDDGRRTPYGFRWPTGPERILLVSLGTGSAREDVKKRFFSLGQHVEAVRAISVLATVIQDTVNQAVYTLQALSAPAKPVHLNSELEAMEGLLSPETPLLTFRRLDPTLEPAWLDENLPDGPPGKRQRPWARVRAKVRRLNDLARAQTRNLAWLHHIGRAYAKGVIEDDDFPRGFDIDVMERGAAVASGAGTGSGTGTGEGEDDAASPRVERIARVAHDAMRAWKRAIGQDPGPEWEDAEDWMRVSSRAAVAHRLANPSAPASAEHERWMAEKRAAGWRYGPERNDAEKVHPMLVDYARLPEEERKKDTLILAVIDALSR